MNFAKEDAPGKLPASGASSKPEGKTITMAMIAKAAGVSQGAISSLLNDRDYGIRVSAKTRERVFRVCREMGYVPNDLRAVVRMYPEQGEIALLLADNVGLQDPFADRIFKALAAEAEGHHVSVAYYSPTADYNANPDSLPAPVRIGVASKFITFGAPNQSLLSAITSREFPAVHLGHDVPLPGVTSIVPKYAEASRQAIEYLFKLGHKQIAILSGPFGSTEPSIIELNFGVRAGYDAIKTPIEAQNVIYGDATFEHGATSIDLLLERERPRKPTAVFCFTDLVAAGVLHRAQSKGLNIPGDLSVMGCGDAIFSPWLHPALTTVAISAEEMTKQALQELSRRIHEEDLSTTRQISIGSQVIERESCGPVKG